MQDHPINSDILQKYKDPDEELYSVSCVCVTERAINEYAQKWLHRNHPKKADNHKFIVEKNATLGRKKVYSGTLFIFILQKGE